MIPWDLIFFVTVVATSYVDRSTNISLTRSVFEPTEIEFPTFAIVEYTTSFLRNFHDHHFDFYTDAHTKEVEFDFHPDF